VKPPAGLQALLHISLHQLLLLLLLQAHLLGLAALAWHQQQQQQQQAFQAAAAVVMTSRGSFQALQDLQDFHTAFLALRMVCYHLLGLLSQVQQLVLRRNLLCNLRCLEAQVSAA
jgi:hypothetical protein